MTRMRLQRALARAGVASRRKARDLTWPGRRATVFDLLPKVPGLTYVGRLDVREIEAIERLHGAA